MVTHKFIVASKQGRLLKKLYVFFFSFCSSLIIVCPLLQHVDSSMVKIFIILQAIFGGLYANHDTPQYTCATTESEKDEISDMEIVSILYKAFFAFYCLLIAIVFCYYGIRSLLTVRGTTVEEKDGIVMKVRVTFFST